MKQSKALERVIVDAEHPLNPKICRARDLADSEGEGRFRWKCVKVSALLETGAHRAVETAVGKAFAR